MASRILPGNIEHPTGATPRNPLLVRDDVGKARSTCYDLPHKQFVYGRPDSMDAEGAREVTMMWKTHTPSGRADGNMDFLNLNKKALAAKAVKYPEVGAFRQTAAMMMTPRSGAGGYANETARRAASQGASQSTRKPMVFPHDVDPKFTYGQPVRPSTPVLQVVQHHFGERAEQDLQDFYTDYHALRANGAGSTKRKIPHTKASRGHAGALNKGWAMDETPREPFKMSKFKGATPRTDTNLGRHPTVAKNIDRRLGDGDDSAIQIATGCKTLDVDASGIGHLTA